MLDIGGKKYYEVFKAGTYQLPDNKSVTITPADLKTVSENYDPLKFHEAPVWIGHPDDEKAEALGWVESVYADGESLYVCFSFISEDWKQLVASEKYKYVSVELPLMDVNGKQQRYLYAIGLTNKPAVRGLEPIMFRDHKFNTSATEFLKFSFPIFNQSNKTTMNEHLMKIAEMCGLKASDFSDDAALAVAVGKQVADFKTNIEDLQKKVKAADTTGNDAKFAELNNKIKTLEGERVVNLIDTAITAGKIIPAQKESMIKLAEANYDEAKKMIDAAPKNPAFAQNMVQDDPSKRIDASDPKFKDPKTGAPLTFVNYCKYRGSKDSSLKEYAAKFTDAEVKALPGYSDVPDPSQSKK